MLFYHPQTNIEHIASQKTKYYHENEPENNKSFHPSQIVYNIKLYSSIINTRLSNVVGLLIVDNTVIVTFSYQKLSNNCNSCAVLFISFKCKCILWFSQKVTKSLPDMSLIKVLFLKRFI